MTPNYDLQRKLLFCPLCGKNVLGPTARDIVVGHYTCGYCAEEIKVGREELADLVVSLMVRVDDLEEALDRGDQ
jgi:hypothetical protein